MKFIPIGRSTDAFQKSLTASEVIEVCRRMFGSEVVVDGVTELAHGMYNNTYRIDLAAHPAVILRVAPEPSQQNRIERELLRNEYATWPYLAALGPLVPRILGADFTHDIVGRDYVFQEFLPGTPAPDALGQYPRASWVSLYQQLGSITQTIHSVLGDRFGPVAGPWFESWSEALVTYFSDLAADLDDAGLASDDVQRVGTAVSQEHALFDEIASPRLLHGDLWTVNVMLDSGASEPTICGVFDNDRTLWGDPEADWTIFMAARRPGTERDVFWTTYGNLSAGPAARRRRTFYAARHVGAIRLERHRLGNMAGVAETYELMGALLEDLSE